jgi:hypothetical protein
MPVLRHEGGRFHGLFLVNQTTLTAKNGQLPSLVQEATSTRKVQSATTRSNVDRILLACYPLP